MTQKFAGLWLSLGLSAACILASSACSSSHETRSSSGTGGAAGAAGGGSGGSSAPTGGTGGAAATAGAGSGGGAGGTGGAGGGAGASSDAGGDAAPLTGVHISQNGGYLINGVPFFPVGAYVVSWQLSTPVILDDLQQIKAAGFNTAHLGLSNDDLTILDRANELGLMIAVEGAGEDQVARIKAHPALLAWNIQDEPDINGVSPSQVQAYQDSFKSWDAAHPTLIVVTDPTRYAEYAAIPDIFGIDPYINQYSATPISFVGDCTAAALAQRSALLVVAHAFAEGGRFLLPTVAQERSIVYQALVHGARGLLFFAFHSPPSDNWFMPDHADFFAGVKTLLGELNVIGPILATATTRQPLALATDGVMAAYVVSGAKRYLLVVSSLDHPVAAVQFTLDADAASANVLFESRSISITGRSFTDDLDAFGSHVYEVD